MFYQHRVGTPLYLYDRAMLDKTVKAYQAALAEFYPGESSFAYAGKAFLCLAITEWTQERSLLTAGVWLDHGQVQVIQVCESSEDLFRRSHRLVKPRL